MQKKYTANLDWKKQRFWKHRMWQNKCSQKEHSKNVHKWKKVQVSRIEDRVKVSINNYVNNLHNMHKTDTEKHKKAQPAKMKSHENGTKINYKTGHQ